MEWNWKLLTIRVTFRFHEYFQTFQKNKNWKDIFIAHRFQFKFPNLLFSTYITYVHTTSTRQYRENPSFDKGGRKIRRTPGGREDKRYERAALVNFLSIYVPACTRVVYTHIHTWPTDTTTLALETSPCTTGAGNRLDNTATRSRALQPTVLARISGCLRALSMFPASRTTTSRVHGTRIWRAYIYIYIIGGGSENAFVIVLPTEARELVAVSAAAIPRGRGGGEGVLQASYNRMLCRFSKWLLDIIRIWIWTGGFVGLEGIPWDDDRFGGGGSPRVIGDYTRSTRVECFWICSRNVAIFVETFAWYYICNIFSMLMSKEYKRIYIPVEGKWMDLLNLFMIVVSFDLVDLIVNCLWKIW